MGDDFLVQKLPSCLFYVSNHNHVLRRFLTLFFPLCFPFKTLMISLLWPFSTVAFYAYFTALLRLILSFNFPWYFPEKSGNICLLFRHVSFTTQWIFILFNLFRWVFFLSYPICIRLFIRISIFVCLFEYRHSFIHPHTYWFSSSSHLFELFSYSYLFVYLFVIIRLIIRSFFVLFPYHFVLSFELFSILTYLFHVLCSC